MIEVKMDELSYLSILIDEGHLWTRKDRNKLRRAPFCIALDWELDYQGRKLEATNQES